MEGGHVALADLSTMQEFTGLQGWVDRIDLRLKTEATSRDVEEIRASLPPGLVLHAPTETRDTGRSMINAYQLNLSVLSFVSLFVGMFLVYSLVSLNAASRRRELAILLSLGCLFKNDFPSDSFRGIHAGVSGLAPCHSHRISFCEIPPGRGEQHHYQPVRACPRGNTSVELL